MNYLPEEHLKDYSKDLGMIVYEFTFCNPSDIAKKGMLCIMENISKRLEQAHENVEKIKERNNDR